jgi:hypothetical protein
MLLTRPRRTDPDHPGRRHGARPRRELQRPRSRRTSAAVKYYEMYNKLNVSLVSLRETLIAKVTASLNPSGYHPPQPTG